MIIKVHHHKNAGRGFPRPYLAHLRPDGHGGVTREFVERKKVGNNRLCFITAIASGDVVEFRHVYWGGDSFAEAVQLGHDRDTGTPVGFGRQSGAVVTGVDNGDGTRTVPQYIKHVAGGTVWLARLGDRIAVLTRDEAMRLALAPRLDGQAEAVTVPALRPALPMIEGVDFDDAYETMDELMAAVAQMQPPAPAEVESAEIEAPRPFDPDAPIAAGDSVEHIASPAKFGRGRVVEITARSIKVAWEKGGYRGRSTTVKMLPDALRKVPS